MPIKENCQNCELYYHCTQYGKIPKENKCPDWELNFNIWQGLTEIEIKEFEETHPEYKKPDWIKN